MATGKKQQIQRNIVKHKSYLRFLKYYYGCKDGELVESIKAIIKIEKCKLKRLG